MDFGMLFNTYVLPLWVALYPYILGGGTAVGALYFLKWLVANPDSKYNMYYPWVIQAVKFAEKSIKDNAKSKSLRKADAFLKHFIELYEADHGKQPPEALKMWAGRMKELALLEVEKAKAAKKTTTGK